MRKEFIEKIIYNYNEIPEEHKQTIKNKLIERYFDYDINLDIEDNIVCSVECHSFFENINKKELSYDIENNYINFDCDIDIKKAINEFYKDENVDKKNISIQYFTAIINKYCDVYIYYNEEYRNRGFEPVVIYDVNNDKHKLSHTKKKIIRNLIESFESFLINAYYDLISKCLSASKEILYYPYNEDNLAEFASEFEFHVIEDNFKECKIISI